MALSSSGHGQGASVKEEPTEKNNRQEISPPPEVVSSQSAAFPAQNAMPDTRTNQSLATAAASLAVLAAQQQQQQQLQQAISVPQVLAPQQLQVPLYHPAIMTHNLIPAHMQASALAPSLLGTPGFQPAFIAPPQVFDASQPVLSVQDRPLIPPVFNGVHPHYPGLQMLHSNPPVFCVDNFLNEQECNFLIQAASDCFAPAPVVGAGVGEVSPSRTSSTCYLAREDLPDYMRKISLLTGKPVEHCELPQVGRYLPTQQYLQHFDAFDLSNEDGRRFAANGGQRTVTVLVYLNDVQHGGHTAFPALNLEITPKRGMAVVFFPATIDGLLDKMALHAALPAAEGHVKYVSQVWIRQGEYTGQPSKRLKQIMGVPFPAPAAEPMTGISYPSHG